LKITAKNAARPWGFTLVELLTVVAIIAVLATLLTSTLGSAKRKARKTASVSNLRQISLAFHLYRDDHLKRPPDYRAMADGKYLNARVLLCPEDRAFQNWAGLIEGSAESRNFMGIPRADFESPALVDLPHSYFKAFHLEREQWDEIERDPLGGVAACQLHGIGRQEMDSGPLLTAYQGLVLRALKDGSVISRQVFWNDPGADVVSVAPTILGGPSPLPLFLDPPTE
jgi:prepilin-type N-terminal cleavage/methylation domain-containing protein